jgi:tetratricopeptide (TPR) repeat protein
MLGSFRLSSSQAETMRDIGQISYEVGRKQDAFENYVKATKAFVELMKNATNSQYKLRYMHLAATSYEALAGIYLKENDKQNAITSYIEAAKLFALRGNHRDEARTLTTIAEIYASFRDVKGDEKAAEFKLKATEAANRALLAAPAKPAP